MTTLAWGSEKAFAKEVTYSNEEQVWKPGRFCRENSIYKVLGCEIARLLLGMERNSVRQGCRWGQGEV